MENEKLLHDLIVDRLKWKLSREFKELILRKEGNPDIVLANHGLTIAVIEVETDMTINPENAEKWNKLVQSGLKLILMVPKNTKAKVTELLWKTGLADKVSLGTYEIVINMP